MLNSSSKSHQRVWNKVGERVRRDFLLQAAAGMLPGVAVQRIHGVNPAVASVRTPIWPGAGQYPYFQDARSVQIVSDSINDTNQGTGAWVVRLIGLDDSHEVQLEDITLRGTTPVISQGDYTHVYAAVILRSATRIGLDGVLTLTDRRDSNILGYVTSDSNRMENGLFTVPAHTNAYLFDVHFDVDSIQTIQIGVRYTTPVEDDETWVSLYDDQTSTGSYGEEFSIPFFLPPLTDFELTAYRSGGVGAAIQAAATILLIDTAFEWNQFKWQDEQVSISRPDADEGY